MTLRPPVLSRVPQPAPAELTWQPRLSLSVSGIPRPGGSKTATLIRRKGGEIVMSNGRPLITTREAGKYTEDWRSLVSYTAKREWRGELLSGPLRLSVVFFMPRPKSHSTKRGLRPNAPTYHTCKPDRTKLMRAFEDALTGILWVDDTQIVAGPVEKKYGAPGVECLVEELAPAPATKVGAA